MGHEPTLRNGVELHLEGGGAHSDRNNDIESTATSASGGPPLLSRVG